MPLRLWGQTVPPGASCAFGSKLYMPGGRIVPPVASCALGNGLCPQGRVVHLEVNCVSRVVFCPWGRTLPPESKCALEANFAIRAGKFRLWQQTVLFKEKLCPGMILDSREQIKLFQIPSYLTCLEAQHSVSPVCAGIRARGVFSQVGISTPVGRPVFFLRAQFDARGTLRNFLEGASRRLRGYGVSVKFPNPV